MLCFRANFYAILLMTGCSEDVVSYYEHRYQLLL